MTKAEAMTIKVGQKVLVKHAGVVHKATVTKVPTFSGAKWSSHFNVKFEDGTDKSVMFQAVNTIPETKKVAQSSIKGMSASELIELAKALKTLNDLGYTVDLQ